MNSTDEREGFRDRLQQALRDAQYADVGPTQLAREFNIRFDGRAITVHAARKWLVGESIPTQEKLRALAQWLGVTTEWLRFGAAQHTPHSSNSTTDGYDPQHARVIDDLRRLNEHDQAIARDFIRMLVRMRQ
ncbi:hypothetical protein [Noviherbaspirillum malthae]|jgi:transcriptional regulator with XRE-family HTH domain|uniref:hypothetical protein n=1 Tax=Noviherbaspirillum malthae TaxID=1260987 RepID=UPI00188E8CD1|nr:hypothetical protein [Noviherbaspirillum malthae]